MNRKIINADLDFVKRIRTAAINRIKNGIDLELRRDPAITKMMINCPSFKKVEEELSKLPKKEDIR